ncbi:MAG: RtcB family protein [Fretibacterium sp.]|nr:RtcB family protein [Fretibacterium sp.]
MILIEGLYNHAVVYTDELEEGAADQIRTLCDQPFSEGSRIRVMPDVHAGAGCTIGTTMTVHDKIVPNLVGVDIGCGMEVVRLAERDISCARFDSLVRKLIPSGRAVRKRPHAFAERVDPDGLRCAPHVKRDRARLSIGTLGGGNHFIELNRDEEGTLYLVVHSGSRHVGLQVANFYQKEGYRELSGAEGGKREGKKRRARGASVNKSQIPRDLAYVSGSLFRDYLHDMKLMQEFADWNRRAMVQDLTEGMGLTVEDRFTTVHNTIDTDSMILRKGAVSARKGQRFLLPMNMRDGSLICIGKGNAEWNYSAPHGAGRLMSRTAARQHLCMDEFEASMDGIYSTSVNRGTLDEAPMAYKPMESILRHLTDTAEVVSHLKPIYNFKAKE